jgi:hypothetical protein
MIALSFIDHLGGPDVRSLIMSGGIVAPFGGRRKEAVTGGEHA